MEEKNSATDAAEDRSHPPTKTSSTTTSSSRELVAATLAELSESKGSAASTGATTELSESRGSATSSGATSGDGGPNDDDDDDDEINLKGIELSKKCENGYTEIFPQRVRVEI